MPTLHSPAKAARSFAAIMGPLRYSGGVLGAPTAGDENPVEVSARDSSGGPNGIRTRVSALRGPCPGPLDDGAGQSTVSGWGRRARTPITGARTRRPTIRRSPRITATTHD